MITAWLKRNIIVMVAVKWIGKKIKQKFSLLEIVLAGKQKRKKRWREPGTDLI